MPIATPPSESSESTEMSQESRLPNIENLLKSALEKVLGKPANPEEFDKYRANRDTLHEKIRTRMRLMLKEEPTAWAAITDDMIRSEIREDNLKDRIARYYSGLVLQRKRALDRAIEIFPSIKDQRADWKNILQASMAGHDEVALRNKILRTRDMKDFLYTVFPRLKTETTNEKRDFDRIFHDKNIYLRDDNQRNKLRDMYHNYDTYQQVPDGDDIAYVLRIYAAAPSVRQKEILSKLGVSLSIRQAYKDFGLIDDVFLESLAEREMGEIYMTLDNDAKKDFIASLSENEAIVISAHDFDETKVGALLGSEQKSKKLGEAISRTIQEDTPENTRPNSISKQIRDRKKKEYGEGGYNYDGNWDFSDVIDQIIINNETNSIKNIRDLKTPNAVIEFKDNAGNLQYMRIKDVDREIYGGGGYGLTLEGLPVIDGILGSSQSFEWTYDDFAENLKNLKDARVLRSEEFNNLLVNTIDNAINGKIYDGRPAIEADPVTAENIADRLDIIDTIGRSYGFGVGTAFVAPSQESGTNGKIEQDDVWQVDKISGDRIDLMASNGFILKNQEMSTIYEVLKQSGNFERIGRFNSDDDILTGLKSFDLESSAELKDGQLIAKEKDEKGDEHTKKITCFKSGKGGHIRMESIKGGLVKFGEFDDGGNEMSKIKEYAKKKGINDKKIKGLYTWKVMSYGAFLRYLESEGLKASSTDPIVPDAHHDLDHAHAEHAHMTSNLLGRILKWQNPASIIKGIEMVWHGIEHTLEKGAKLDAARFAMGTAKFLHIDNTSVGAQIYADITNGSKEIIEKIESKIFGIPGPAGRWKAIHIAHNRDSRPEEVMAAMNYMLKSYGHFYAEDIKHYQPRVNKNTLATADAGYFAFLDGFIITSKIGDLNTWRKKAYDKAIKEMGTEEDHENEPSEEQLVHALTKVIDGKWGEFPYAAGVVKAIGGPGGFEKNWKFEGFENAHKKGVDQTQMVNAQGRLNKGVGYFGTHEIYKAAGAMEAVAGKIKSPEYQAMPFIWACGGYSRYASHTALNKIKGYGEGGMSFHAYGFLRNEGDNITYRETVALAVKDLIAQGKIQASATEEFETLCKRMEKVESKETIDGKYGGVSASEGMMQFWQKYQGKGLHDALQGKNGWLIKKVRDRDATAIKYQKTLYDVHGNMLNNDSIPGTPFGKDWFDEHGYQNIIVAPGDDGLGSMKSMLNKIKFGGYSGGGKPMIDEHYKKIWKYIVNHVNEGLKDTASFHGDEALQKEQYLAYRKEMIDYFAQQLGSRSKPESMKDTLGTYPYFREFESMGIDPISLFYEAKVAENAESDYQNWKSGGRSTLRKDVPDIEAIVQGKVAKINSKSSQPPPKGNLPYKKGKERNIGGGGDSDASYSGGSGDAGGGDGGGD